MLIICKRSPDVKTGTATSIDFGWNYAYTYIIKNCITRIRLRSYNDRFTNTREMHSTSVVVQYRVQKK